MQSLFLIKNPSNIKSDRRPSIRYHTYDAGGRENVAMVRSSIALTAVIAYSAASLSTVHGYAPSRLHMTAPSHQSSSSKISIPASSSSSSRRGFVSKSIAFALGTTTAASLASIDNTGGVANAVGPIKIDIVNPTYKAAPCPKDKPIPGEKAMKGMRGLCVQVKAELAENSPKVS